MEERLKMNARKTFPKRSRFWNAKVCWNIKTFPKCFNIFMHTEALIRI